MPSDQTDAQSWYLLGRCYMSQQKYPKAYEAYQQAVYRDGRNPTFWCSIGVLYYQINQYRDALDAYSRAIRLNPNISEVWYDLGTLVSYLVATEESMDDLLTCHSMSRATTRPAMLSTHTHAQLNSTPPMSTSRRGWHCLKVNPLMVCQTRVARHCLRMFTHRRTSRAHLALRQVHNGARTLRTLLHRARHRGH